MVENLSAKPKHVGAVKWSQLSVGYAIFDPHGKRSNTAFL